ncbi:MAG: glutamate racemase [candidate division Zixibacteria bacterium RBG_16_48_11]|nr:MAG: glutamate racemase [candidate division Zixibacteria bacterium RBG_16_48_11]
MGVFDSGVGGLTVVREIFRQLPQENVVYFGDTGRFPYGTRSPDAIRHFSLQAANFLLEQKVKLIVVACNTASAQALGFLEKKVETSILGVILPGAKKAVASSRNRRIGIIGTEATVASGSYPEAIAQLDSQVKVFSYPCPLFVALAEEGYLKKKASFLIAQDYLSPLKKLQVDTLILGCTHFPLLKPIIQKVMGPKVTLTDAAESVAGETKELLAQLGLLNQAGAGGKHKFFVSDFPEKFKRLSRSFLRCQLDSVQKIEINRY